MVTYPTVLKGFKLAAGKGTQIKKTHVKIGGSVAISGNMKAGYVDDFLLEDSRITGDPDLPFKSLPNPADQKGQLWGARVYNLRDCIVRGTFFANILLEHGFYFGHGGDVTFEDCDFRDIGSQGVQSAQRECDCFGGRADNVKCLMRFHRCLFERCATPQGRRPSWNLTVFGFDENVRMSYPDGPEHLINGKPHKGHMVRSLTDVEIVGCQFKGYGFPHTASGSRVCDSTGAVLIQDRMRALIDRCDFDFKDPDREIVQVRNVADFTMKNSRMNGGDIVLHNMDACKVRISGCNGNGEIRRRTLGSHTTKVIGKVAQGFSQN